MFQHNDKYILYHLLHKEKKKNITESVKKETYEALYKFETFTQKIKVILILLH